MLIEKFSRNIMSIGIQTVLQYSICSGVTFGSLTLLLRFRTNICPCWLDVMYQPRSSVCGIMISQGLKINEGLKIKSPKWAFGHKQEAHLRWTRNCSRVNWEEFIRSEVRANETYSKAKRQVSDRKRDVLMNVQSPHK